MDLTSTCRKRKSTRSTANSDTKRPTIACREPEEAIQVDSAGSHVEDHKLSETEEEHKLKAQVVELLVQLNQLQRGEPTPKMVKGSSLSQEM